MPVHSLEAIATSLGLISGQRKGRKTFSHRQMNTKDKDMLEQQLLSLFEDPAELDKFVDRLPTEEKLALQAILFNWEEAGQMAFYNARLWIKRVLDQNMAHQDVFTRLTDKGLAFSASSDHGWHDIYTVADEMVAPIYLSAGRELAPHVLEEGNQQTEEPVIIKDICLFLAATRVGNLRGTSGGQIHQTDMKKVKSFFPSYPDGRCQVIALIANLLGLVENNRGRLAMADQAVLWAAKPLAEQWRQVLVATFEHLLPKVFTDASGIHLVNILKIFPAHYLPLTQVAKLMARAQATKQDAGLTEASINAVADILTWVGYLDGFQTPDGVAVRIAPAAVRLMKGDGVSLPVSFQEENFVVQPNFEILADQHLSPPVLWELCQYADPVQADRMITCRLTRASLYRAWQAGKKLPEIISFLQRHSQFPVPQNVLASLEDWYRQMGRMHLYQTIVLHCDTPELATELKMHRKIAPFVVGQLSPQDLLVRLGAGETVITHLRKAGYFPDPALHSDPIGEDPKIATGRPAPASNQPRKR